MEHCTKATFPNLGEQNVSSAPTTWDQYEFISPVGKRVLGLPPFYEVQGSWRTDGVNVGRRGQIKVQ